MTALNVVAVPVYHKTSQEFRIVWMIFFTFEAIPSWVHVCVYSFKFLCSDKTKRPVVPGYPDGNLIEDNMQFYRDTNWLSIDF